MHGTTLTRTSAVQATHPSLKCRPCPRSRNNTWTVNILSKTLASIANLKIPTKHRLQSCQGFSRYISLHAGCVGRSFTRLNRWCWYNPQLVIPTFDITPIHSCPSQLFRWLAQGFRSPYSKHMQNWCQETDLRTSEKWACTLILQDLNIISNLCTWVYHKYGYSLIQVAPTCKASCSCAWAASTISWRYLSENGCWPQPVIPNIGDIYVRWRNYCKNHCKTMYLLWSGSFDWIGYIHVIYIYIYIHMYTRIFLSLSLYIYR